MSSAILYAAIVAIWVCVLVPRWLKRDTAQAPAAPEVAGGQPAGTREDAHADGAETMTGDMTGRDAEAARTTAATAAQENSAPAAAHQDSGTDQTAQGGQPAAGREIDQAETRQRIVAARRRMLLILITLTVAAIGIAGLKLAAWWVAVPPVLMLGGYLMLLREASRADRERALLDAAAYRDEQRQRYAEEQEAAGRAAEAPPAPVAPTARVIDISGRVRDEDEIYDQYADGTRRAVGD